MRFLQIMLLKGYNMNTKQIEKLHSLYYDACIELQAFALREDLTYRDKSYKSGLNLRQLGRVANWNTDKNFPVKIEHVIKALSRLNRSNKLIDVLADDLK